jgi:hypothetical protein
VVTRLTHELVERVYVKNVFKHMNVSWI